LSKSPERASMGSWSSSGVCDINRNSHQQKSTGRMLCVAFSHIS
jgi:hypothetical protein